MRFLHCLVVGALALPACLDEDVDVGSRDDELFVVFPTVPLVNGHSQYSGWVHVKDTSNGGKRRMIDPTRGRGNSRAGWRAGNMVGVRATSGLSVFETTASTWGNGQNYTKLDYDQGRDPMSAWGQTAAVDVMYGFQEAWDLLDKVFQRKSYDGNSTAMVAGLHAISGQTAWDPSTETLHVVLPRFRERQHTTLDIVGHELGHALLNSFAPTPSGYPDTGEWAGIREACADIFGTLVEFYANGHGTTVVPDVGGDWILFAQQRGTVRHMDLPSTDKTSPDEWEEGLATLDGHYANGPINRMFYFLSQGAEPFDVDGLNQRATYRVFDGFAGVGNHRAAKIWFGSLARLTAGADFSAMRNAMLASADSEYGRYDEFFATSKSFAAVNVGPAYETRAPEIANLQVADVGTWVWTLTTATDDTEIAAVRLYVDGVQLGATDVSPPYLHAFPKSILPSGTHAVEIRAYDIFGNMASKTRMMTTDVVAPVIQDLTYRREDGHLLEATVLDDVGIERVEFFLDGEHLQTRSTPARENTSYVPPAPYPSSFRVQQVFALWRFVSPDVSTGEHVLSAVAYDHEGNKATDSRTFYLDNTPPSVVPRVNGTRGTIRVLADVDDDSPGELVTEFFIDGGFTCKRSGDTPRCDVDSTLYPDGMRELRVVVEDGANQTVVHLDFQIDNSSPPPPPPPPSEVEFDESENNNSLNQADAPPSNVDVILGSASGGASADRDWFRIRGYDGGGWQFTSSYSGSLSYCVDLDWIFLPDGASWFEQLATSSETGPTTEVLTAVPDYAARRGTYYLLVTASCGIAYEVEIERD